MATRARGYYLSNGLYVSGLPDNSKEKTSTISSAPAPYTGGDLKKNSGDFEKMFPSSSSGTITRQKSGPQTGTGTGTRQKSGPQTGTSTGTRQKSGPLAGTGTGSTGTRQKSGPLTGTGTGTKQKSSSGPIVKKSSGPQSPIIPTTGLITSGPLKSANSSGPLLNESTARSLTLTGQSQPSQSQTGQCKMDLKRGVPRVLVWVLAVLFVLGFSGGGFVIYKFKSWIVLAVVGGLFAIFLGIWVWNKLWGPRKVVLGFLERYADAELRSAKDGQFIKVTGIVTCGSVPLETSFLRVPRCVYTSTALYEYRGNGSMTSANEQHRRFSWGIRSLERHVVDFYISDFQSGLRALVKAGNGAKVFPFVDECVVSDVNAAKSKDLPLDFVRWLAQRNLSSDDRIMRLKEGFIKEGSTVSVMGVVQRHDNVLMIVPPSVPVSTGCNWYWFLLPASLNGIVLHCQDASETDVIPV